MEGHKFVKGDITFTFKKLDKLTGDAELSMRKGKQMLCYDFETDVEWFAEASYGEADGSFHILDINQADMDFQV